MSQTPGELPPPPPQTTSPQPAVGPTEIAGQQVAPSTSVPHDPGATVGPAAGAGTNTLAVVSLVAAIGSFFAHIVPGIGGFTVALIAAVTGFMARNQIKKTGEQGMGLATAGMVIGIIHMLLIILVVVVFVILVFVLGFALFGFHPSR